MTDEEWRSMRQFLEKFRMGKNFDPDEWAKIMELLMKDYIERGNE